MNILADESVAAPIVAQLRQAGHDVQFITELAPGSSDPAILVRANQDDRLLLTADKDFGELVVRYG
jgi:predicted nuclease of predicted toxin-antitoxin system